MKTVLIVDDNIKNLDLFKDFVESWDWMDIKNFRFCFIQNMKHLQIRA